MIRRPPRSTQSRSSAASDVYKRQDDGCVHRTPQESLSQSLEAQQKERSIEDDDRRADGNDLEEVIQNNRESRDASRSQINRDDEEGKRKGIDETPDRYADDVTNRSNDDLPRHVVHSQG